MDIRDVSYVETFASDEKEVNRQQEIQGQGKVQGIGQQVEG